MAEAQPNRKPTHGATSAEAGRWAKATPQVVVWLSEVPVIPFGVAIATG
jgi:hypothetical protein